MGSFLSKPIVFEEQLDPYETLGVHKLSQLTEIKKAYSTLFYKSQRNAEEMEKLNKAKQEISNKFEVDLYLEMYQKIYKEEKISCVYTPNNLTVIIKNKEKFIKYKEFFFTFNFLSTTSDVFEKLSLAFNIKCAPKLLDAEFIKFYNFWSRFLSNDKELQEKIRKLVKIVKRNDPRTEIKIFKEDVKKEEKKIEKVNFVKNFKIQCVSCNKGFNSLNTLKDHINSKKHKENSINGENIIYNIAKTE